MVVGAEDLDLDAERLAEEAHGLEALLVIGATAADKDADLVLLEAVLVLLEGRDDALERRRDVGEVGNAAADEEDLALGVRRAAGHEVDCARGGERGGRSATALLLSRRTQRERERDARMVLAYSYVWVCVGAPEYSP